MFDWIYKNKGSKLVTNQKYNFNYVVNYLYNHLFNLPMTAYDELLEISKELNNIENAISLLAWDQRTYMPKGAIEGRSKTISDLSRIYHRLMTSDRLRKVIDKLNKESVKADLNEVQKAAVREMTRDFERKYKIPDELVKEMATVSSKAQAAWEKSREISDFEIFLPHLNKQVELKKQVAEYIGYKKEPYDALVDGFEPGFTAKKIKKIFDPMKKKLSSLVEDILVQDATPGQGVFDNRKFNIKKQKKLCKELAKTIGYDFHHGRLDEAVHPFTMGMDDDVRITNRYTEENISSLFSLLHESGHGIYEQGIPEEWYGHPLGQRISMGYHESQSRLWENFVGRSREFMSFIYPKLTETFPILNDEKEEEIYHAINRVEPSYIRVEADEVTYNLHIALRFDIELAMFRDELEPHETQEVWKEKMDNYFGIIPEDPAKGVLQDIHWSSGDFGYFPSYALGNLYAAQIYNKVSDEIDNIQEKIAKGKFSGLKNWLNGNIHQHGRRYKAEEMTKRLTGEKLNEDHYIDYLKDKYCPIYSI